MVGIGAAVLFVDSGGVGDTTPTSTPEEDESDEYECLANPYDYNESDNYTYGEYAMWMPDRFAEDILETEGVAAFYAGMEGHAAGLVHLVITENGAEPVVYCRASDSEGFVLTDYYHGVSDSTNGDKGFTPTKARATVDPTFEEGMGISDQSVEWLLEQDHVNRVEHVRTCGPAGCDSKVKVYVDGDYPPEDYWRSLPNVIDGIEVNYVGSE